MNILSFPLGQLQANCYFLIKNRDLIIIDPADSADFILEEIQRRNLHLIGMIASHGHFDHMMAAGEIQLSFPVPLYIHSEDLFLLKRLRETAKHFLGYDPTIVDPTILESIEHAPFDIFDTKYMIFNTPGHTPGSCCFYFKNDQVLFTGDTLFKQGLGRYDFSYSDKYKLLNSIKKLFELPLETIIYSGHGDETTIEEERRNLNL